MIGQAIDRLDGEIKVTGMATYAADIRVDGLAHAVLVTSTIAGGRVIDIDSTRATAHSGVIGVLTHRNAPRLAPPEPGQLPLLLQDDAVMYSGQPVAMVVGETRSAALAGARLVQVCCNLAAGTYSIDEGAESFAPAAVSGQPSSSTRGDVQRALNDAEVHVEQTYITPMQFHHPIEPHAALAVWDGPDLTIHATVQGVQASRDMLAAAFGLAPERIRVVSRFLGGGFGSKGRSWWPCLLLSAMAARNFQRPVMLELSREDMFAVVGCRAEARHRIELGAKHDGRLTAMIHETTAQGSLDGEFCDAHGGISRMLYACQNVAVSHRVVRLNRPHPTPMRSPGYGPGSFALESAMDELAYAAGIDPLEIRIRNHAERDLHTGLPWSSKSLLECYSVGAEQFRWSQYSPEPCSMRDGRLLIGRGVASATYPAHRQPAAAYARLESDGTVVVQSATHDIGTGTYTVMTQVAAEVLGLPIDRIRFELGDSALPLSPRAAGSWTAASVSPAVSLATIALRRRIIDAACADDQSALHGVDPATIEIRDGWLRARHNPSSTDSYAAIAIRNAGYPIDAAGESRPGPEQYSMHAFGANFVEVSVDPDLGKVRVRRVVACYGAGRILNHKTARSQMIGGLVFGLGMALGEAAIVDANLGRVLNARLTDYLLPVNADVPSIDVCFIDEHDPHVNSIGVKGIGMIGAVGLTAAVANAVFHATGKRIRDLPITLDKLLDRT
jgi:xanthine dehydrogenase YagR molybdenum-binding subunit